DPVLDRPHECGALFTQARRVEEVLLQVDQDESTHGSILPPGHFGGIRMAPSTRTVSPFMYELVTHSRTMLASSSGWPRRLGKLTDWPSLALNSSAASPSP